MSTNLIGKSITNLHQLLLFCVIFQWINHVNGIYMLRRFPERSRIPCEDPEPLPNGFSVAKRRNMLLQHYCNYGFKLIGDRRTQCNRGKWNGDRPVCAKSGCTMPSENPEHGRIQYIDQYHIGTYCTEGYDLAGNRYAYCNGTDWDRPLGSCRLHSGKVSHECDFETSDICGWVIDISEGFKWRRAMAANVFTSFHTGPRHDHTTMKASGGHYMLMESFGATVTPAALTSPIYGREISLKTACCFQFYYFMYGAGVGNLNVYVKPVSKMLTDVMENEEKYVKFTKSGNQNSKWNEAHFTIDEMEDDFQIVFVADGAKNHLSDIAIDDVRILTGTECKSLDNHSEEPDDSAEYETTTVEESLYDTLSCVSRCSQEANIGIMRESSRLFGLCSCHDSCIVDDDCCPDYVKVCLDAPNDDPNSTVTTPTTITTTTPTPTTTLATTTTTANTASMPSNETLKNTTTTTTREPAATTKTTTPTTKMATTRTTVTLTTTTERRRPIYITTGEVTTTTPKMINTTKATTTTTTRKPTITTTKRTTTSTTTTTKRTTPTTKIPTPTTTNTTTTTTATTAKPKTTTTKRTITTATTKRSTTPSTTPMTSTKIPINTQPIFEVTTGAVIERKAVAGDTEEMPRKEKNQSPKNATKHTWQWQPKPESNPRGTLALLFVFGLLLTVIIASAVYRQRSTLKTLLLGKILQKGQNDNGAEDSNSIIANFRQEDPIPNGTNSSVASGSSGGNRLRISLPSLKRGKQEKRNSAEEDTYCADDENDDIPLL